MEVADELGDDDLSKLNRGRDMGEEKVIIER